MESKWEASQLGCKHADVPTHKRKSEVNVHKAAFCVPTPHIHQVTLNANGALGHTGPGRGRHEALGGSAFVQFAKKVNGNLQFSRKSIKQMSPKHNRIGTMVILHLSVRLGFCHFYDPIKCIFCDHVGICN